MSVIVIPTELDRAGNPVERRDKAKELPDETTARAVLTETISKLMTQAGMTYDPTQTLEQNTAVYYQGTGHAFGWIIEGVRVDVAPRQPMPWIKLAYLLVMSAVLFAAVAFVERAFLALGATSTALQIVTLLRASIGLVLAIGLLRLWISRRRS